MVRITCFIRPHRLEPVKAALAALGVTGLTVSDVRGCGSSQERASGLGSSEHVVALALRTMVELVCKDEVKEQAIEAIVEQAQTGEPGDGKIFVERVSDVIRIRTEERGEIAV